jgi:hypothetical protein
MKLRPPRLTPLKALLLFLGAVWGLGVLTGTYWASRTAEKPVALSAPLVKEIQQLGDLHTVRYNVHDVLQHERAIEPKGWVSAIPGAKGLYDMTTKNSVLVTADGGIEAGLDLSKVSESSVSRIVTPDGTRFRIRLPRAQVYAPEVHVKVVDRKSGLFWQDDNIVPEATEMAATRFRESALKSNILVAAETNAIQRLNKMEQVTGNRNVEFYF